MKKALTRFTKYFISGTLVFLFDLLLLFIFIDYLNINYLFSTGVAFIIAATTNYFICRKYVFPKTTRRLDHGYYYFLIISGLGLIYVVGLMAICVEIFNFNYLISRTVVAGCVGMWNYLMNLFFNFKVYKIH